MTLFKQVSTITTKRHGNAGSYEYPYFTGRKTTVYVVGIPVLTYEKIVHSVEHGIKQVKKA